MFNPVDEAVHTITEAWERLTAEFHKRFTPDPERFVVVAARYKDGERELLWKATAREDHQIQLFLIDRTDTVVTTAHGQDRHRFWSAFKNEVKSWSISNPLENQMVLRRLV